jgi:hypothetical protein
VGGGLVGPDEDGGVEPDGTPGADELRCGRPGPEPEPDVAGGVPGPEAVPLGTAWPGVVGVPVVAPGYLAVDWPVCHTHGEALVAPLT